MTKIEVFRIATAEVGDATPEELSAYIEAKFGVVISPLYIPLFRATLRFQNSSAAPDQSVHSTCLPKTS